MLDKVRTLIVGFGISGRYIHYPLLKNSNSFKVTGVVKKSIGKNDRDMAKDSAFKLYNSIESALVDKELFDIVVLATPNRTHETFAKLIINSGLNLVIEKPISGTEQQVISIFELAKKKKCKVFPFQNRRWDSDYLTVKKLISENIIGDLRIVESNWEQDKPARDTWRNSSSLEELGGITLDIGVHLVDQIVQLLGPVVELRSTIKTLRANAKTDDFMELELVHKNGTTSHLKADNSVKIKSYRFKLHGEKGLITLRDYDNQETVLRSSLNLGKGVHDARNESFKAEIEIGNNSKIIRNYEIGCWSEFYESVSNVLLKGKDFPIKESEIIYNHKILDAARGGNLIIQQ
jgi:scyllo-inositol 2-dehydrogenase (NADP+)